MKKIVIVGGLHGDEPTGVAVAKYFGGNKQENITSFVAHPAAIKKQKRFLETDLNRSFSPKVPVSLEENIAKELKDQLPSLDLLVDIHNTRGDFTTCAITTMKPTVRHYALAAYFGFKHLVIMPPSGSLIALQPKKSLSLEIALNEKDKFSPTILIEKIKRLSTTLLKEKKIPTYRFLQSIKTTTAKRVGIKPQDIKNFKELGVSCKQKLGLAKTKKYYPMFAKKTFSGDVAFELLELVND